MKAQSRIWKQSFTLMALLFLAIAPTSAQNGMGDCCAQGKGMGEGKGMDDCCGQDKAAAMPDYDPNTEMTVTGVIEEVSEQPGGAASGGVHLTLKAGQGIYDVRLGPAAFLVEQDFQLAPGDRIAVTGSKMVGQDSRVVLAREITKGDQVLTLRDARGMPAWSKGMQKGTKKEGMKEGCCTNSM